MHADIHTSSLVAKPFKLQLSTLEGLTESAWKANAALAHACEYENPFSLWQSGSAFRPVVVRELMRPGALVWEVWRREPVDFAGILRLKDIVEGHDAQIDFFFFDGSLRDKEELLKGLVDWAFTPQEGWAALHRLTLELPIHAFAAIRFSKKRLGFAEEGTKRDALFWRGAWEDATLLGLTDAAEDS